MRIDTEEQESNIQLIRLMIRNILHRLEIDRAVFFGLLTKIWGIVVGPTTAILIVICFTRELQGYYYTFTTIVALQVFAELGLGTVIVQFASHEWSKLNIDQSGRIVGDKEALSRLVSIANIAFKWYLVGGVLVTLGLGVGGYFFFSTSPGFGVNWTLPWFSLCIITGIIVCLIPVWSLLEGCNQVSKLYTFRFFQSILTGIIVWIAILSGGGLWTASISGLVTLLFSICFLRWKYWTFLKTLLFTRPQGSKIKWRADMLPMQWRIAISWISGYFCFSLFSPVLFKYHGPVVAGQMGMTWSLVSAMGVISYAWTAPKIPQFGMLIALKRYEELDNLFWRLTGIVVIVTILIGFAIWFLVYALYAMNLSFSTRILPPLPTGLFIIAHILINVSTPFGCYLRAHKKEPLMFISVLGGVLIGLSIPILGKYYSVTAMATSFLIVHLIVVPVVIIIWYYCRKEWHTDN
jgi:O-antigen/teichoic acid export membrane protein